MKKLLIALSLAAFATAQAGQPNILLILADDLGYHDVGFQGSEHIKTPNIDWLAKNGCRFTDGHVTASVCSPSRAGMMTGRYQQRFGHEGNCPPRPFGMDTEERTLGQALQSEGYRTALFGKWHLGDETHHYPTARGFDEFWGLREGSRTYWFNKKHAHDKPGDPRNIEHNGTQVEFKGHLTDCLTDQTLKYIEADSEKPFFVFLSYTAPHGPLQSKPEDMEALGTDDNYAGLIYGMDRNIGRIFQSLEKSGKLDNTMIWFLSDNGGTVKQSSNAPLGGMKGYKFEGGHRVPFVLYWKDKVQAGQSYAPMVSALDIYPTCLAAAGGSLEQPRPLDGHDLLPYILGETKDIPHEKLYWRKLDCAAVRDGQWKLIRVDNYGLALYNLENDLAETTDLAKRMPEKTQELNQLLEKWEIDKVEPPYDETLFWELERHYYHTQRIKTGVNPDMTPAVMKAIRKQAKEQGS
ncbi:sulfatase-like hydrolase/transferase [Pontiellaceae bacterium B12227]|nr:sulfatase-like hydrolase/transferase [Pontiellaceae bacterium B12227]